MFYFVFSYTVLMMSVYTAEGLSLLVCYTAFLEHLAVKDTIVYMIVFDFHIAVLGESFKFMFCLHRLFTTSASLYETEYVVGSMVDHQRSTNGMIFSQNFTIIVTNDTRFPRYKIIA